MKTYLSSLILAIGLIVFNGCGSSDSTSPKGLTAMLADNNVSASAIHSVYDDSFEVQLMRISGGYYKNDIGFWMRYTCNSNCENRAYKIYIDSDSNESTGYQIGGIGADYSLGSNGFFYWQATLWVPDLYQRTHFQIDQTNNAMSVLVYDAGSDFFFKRSTEVVFAIDDATEHLMQSPMIEVKAF